MIKHIVYTHLGSNHYFNVYDEEMWYVFHEIWENDMIKTLKIRGSYPDTPAGKKSAEEHCARIIKNKDY